MNPLKVIEKYYHRDSDEYKYLVTHSRMVAIKAIEVAKRLEHLNPDINFIYEAAMLHDIGIIKTKAPDINCFGNEPYIKHGVLGRQMLEDEGYDKHALVCERHVGAGMSMRYIIEKKLPLPQHDMIPLSIEEKIVCFADKFYSKNKGKFYKELTVQEIEKKLSKFGDRKLGRFIDWRVEFGE